MAPQSEGKRPRPFRCDEDNDIPTNFLDCPRELRDKIYHLAGVVPAAAKIDLCGKGSNAGLAGCPTYHQNRFDGLVTLLPVSRQVHVEVLELFFAKTQICHCIAHGPFMKHEEQAISDQEPSGFCPCPFIARYATQMVLTSVWRPRSFRCLSVPRRWKLDMEVKRVDGKWTCNMVEQARRIDMAFAERKMFSLDEIELMENAIEKSLNGGEGYEKGLSYKGIDIVKNVVESLAQHLLPKQPRMMEKREVNTRGVLLDMSD